MAPANSKTKIPMGRRRNSQNKIPANKAIHGLTKGKSLQGIIAFFCVQSKIIAFELPFQGGSG
jgi:hypothetical protein